MKILYYRLLIISLCGIIFFCVACNSNITNKPILPPNIKIANYDTLLKQTADGWFYKGDLFNGYMLQEEKNHRIVYELPIINGKENGLAKGCYYNGSKLLERYYKEGKCEGIYKQWWPNGHYRYLFNYKDDKLDGQQLVFYPDGKKKQAINYSNGEEEGIQSTWNEQGVLISNFTIKNKKLYGIIEVKNCIPAAH
jgi:antitoxin component YwqK of YwqJK toxin-antitoxin module